MIYPTTKTTVIVVVFAIHDALPELLHLTPHRSPGAPSEEREEKGERRKEKGERRKEKGERREGKEMCLDWHSRPSSRKKSICLSCVGAPQSKSNHILIVAVSENSLIYKEYL